MKFINIAHAGVISDAPTFSAMGSKILTFVLSAVGVVAIIMILIYGAMYFLAFGDQKKIQMAKKALRNWIVGLFVAMSGIIIVKFIAQMFG